MSGERAGGGGGSSGGRESQRSFPTPFLTKTYHLADDPSMDDLISWNEEGTTFIIWRPAEFARDLLPKYFKHNNFSSFVRQLNTYGFRKVVPDRWEFANDLFRRGEKALLKDIQRRKLSSCSTAAATTAGTAQAQSVTVVVPPAVAVQISPANSGEEQVLSSSSFPAATAAPLRACASITEILEENDRLRKQNSQLSRELNLLRSLCSNIYNLMSSYANNQSEAAVPESVALELIPEAADLAAAGGGRGEVDEEEDGAMCPRIFGVSIGLKRLKRNEDRKSNGQMALLVPDVKSEPSDRGSSESHDPGLEKL